MRRRFYLFAWSLLATPLLPVTVASAQPSYWVPTSLHLTDGNITALAVDPFDPDTLYAGTASRGVFKSTNAGAEWSQTTLENTKINVLGTCQ